MVKPNIVITMGDPAGVGPEICIRTLNDKSLKRLCKLQVIGDMGLLKHLSKKLKLKAPVENDVINLSQLALRGSYSLKAGSPTIESSKAMIDYITTGVSMVSKGDAQALVTAPISKEAAKKIGFNFPGHTEYLANLTKSRNFVMMLGGDKLKVALVTIHEALKDVPSLIKKDKVYNTIKITYDSLKNDFKIKNPKICVTGLNPHSGEGGLFGLEEEEEILPAIKKAAKNKMNVTGPLPADTAYYRAYNGEFDCVVSMYHDQALGPLKLVHFEDGVNATLGLPIIRTSVDHGTAYDIAWKGKASYKSLKEAIKWAASMSAAGNRK